MLGIGLPTEPPLASHSSDVDQRDDRRLGRAVVLGDLRPPPFDQRTLHRRRARRSPVQHDARATTPSKPAFTSSGRSTRRFIWVGTRWMFVALIPVDQVEHPRRVVLVLHHRGRPRHHRQERERPLCRVVDRPAQHGHARHGHHLGEAGADQMPHLGRGLLRHRRQSAPDALRVAGRARRVEHRPAEALVVGLVGRSAGDELVEVGEPVVGGRTDHDRSAHAGRLLVVERGRDGVDEAMVGHDGLRSAVAQDVRDLGGHEVPVHRHEGDPGVRTGEHRDEPLVAVAGDDRDRVAVLDAGCRASRGSSGCSAVRRPRRTSASPRRRPARAHRPARSANPFISTDM